MFSKKPLLTLLPLLGSSRSLSKRGKFLPEQKGGMSIQLAKKKRSCPKEVRALQLGELKLQSAKPPRSVRS
jgi:hypothetical protein